MDVSESYEKPRRNRMLAGVTFAGLCGQGQAFCPVVLAPGGLGRGVREIAFVGKPRKPTSRPDRATLWHVPIICGASPVSTRELGILQKARQCDLVPI